MPGIFYQPQDRRSFLKMAALTGASIVMNGCQTARPSSAMSPEFHVALLSDTHVPGDRKNGSRGFNPWENLKTVVPSVVGAQPEAVILNGDAARLEGQLTDYEELKALLAPVAIVAPIFIGMGNHDQRENFAKVFSGRRPERQSLPDKEVLVIDHRAVRLIILDSLLYVNKVPGLLGKNQRQWLEKELAAHRDKPTVIFVHHTLGDADGELLDANRLFELLRPHNHVKAIFYGHSHVWELSERQGIKLINLPAVGYNFRDQDAVGWVDARFHGGGVNLILHAFAGNRAQDGQSFPIKWS